MLPVAKLTQFEQMVMNALITGHAEEATLRTQMASAIVESREYSGCGLFTIMKLNQLCQPIASKDRTILDWQSFQLAHPALEHGAGTLLYIADGYVECLECYTYGEDWPADESLFTLAYA